MKKSCFIIAAAKVLALIFLLSSAGVLYAINAPVHPPLSPPPTREILQQIQSDFLQLQWPIETRLLTKYLNIGFEGSKEYYRLELLGEARAFQDAYHPALIAWALYPFLEDPNYNAEATVILSAVILPIVDNDWSPFKPTTFRSRKEPGNWTEVEKHDADLMKSIAYGYASSGVDQGKVLWKELKKLEKYRVPSDQILPSSLKKAKKSPLASLTALFGTPTATPQATPSQTPMPRGTVEQPKPTSTETATKPDTKPEPKPAAQTEPQKSTWPFWLAAVAIVLSAFGILAYRNRKK